MPEISQDEHRLSMRKMFAAIIILAIIALAAVIIIAFSDSRQMRAPFNTGVEKSKEEILAELSARSESNMTTEEKADVLKALSEASANEGRDEDELTNEEKRGILWLLQVE